MHDLIEALAKLIAAAEPFTSGDVVDETSGTIVLMNELETRIEEAKNLVDKLRQ